MKGNVTPEAAAAHKNLHDLCEKFETSVDEFCASPLQSLRTKDFYESECVPIAVECVDALSKLESARSYEITAYEQTVTQADDTLRQQKRELEKSAAQRAKVYEGKIAGADNTLRQQKCKLEENTAQRAKTYESGIAEAEDTLLQQKRKLEENTAQRAKTYENAIAEDDDTLHQEKRKFKENAAQSIITVQSEIGKLSLGVHPALSEFTHSEPKELLKDTTMAGNSKISYKEALAGAQHYKDFEPLSILFTWMCAVCGFIMTGGIWFLDWATSGIMPSFFFASGGIFLIIFSFLLNSKKKKKVAAAAEALLLAAKGECNIIQKKLQNELVKTLAAHEEKVSELQAWKEQEDRQDAALAAKALAAHEEKVADIQTWKEQEDRQDAALAAKALAAYNKEVEVILARKEGEEKQAAESAAQALAAHEEKVKTAREKKNQAIAYIQQEYKAFDIRLCACLDKFQLFVDTCLIENADATSVLNKNRLQDLRRNSEGIGSCLTRVGTLGIWDISGKTSQGNQDNTKSTKPITTAQPTKHTADTQAVKRYLKTIANTEITTQSIEDTGDTQAVKHYLKTIANTEITTQSIEDTDDTQAVKYYLNMVTNTEENNEDQKNLEEMARQGNAEAQFSLGDIYENGIGRQKSEGEAVNWYCKAAESGHIDALKNLNRIAQQGNTDALKNLNRIAQQGNTEAQFNLGNMYENGIGAPQDIGEAVNWYCKAAKSGHTDALKNLIRIAQQGNTEAQFNLGNMYENGIGAPQDTGKAVKWYCEAAVRHPDALKNLNKMARQGNVEAQFNLGNMYENGRGVQKDYTEAINWYQEAAEHGYTPAKEVLPHLERLKDAEEGNADAQYELGKMYLKMYLKSQSSLDNKKALDYYKKAAEQGHVNALRAFVKLTRFDYSFFFEIHEEAAIYQKAIKNGNADVFATLVKMAEEFTFPPYIIGMIYEEGEGVSRSDCRAMEWYEKAAEQGHAEAQYKLGEMYYNNMYEWSSIINRSDVMKERSFKWYEKAAEQGHAEAQYQLGQMYEKGEWGHGGMYGSFADQPNHKYSNRLAVKSYLKAADLGHSEAQFKLGEIYEKGLHRGVPRDTVQATDWYQKAAEQGHEGAQYALRRMEKGD